LSFCIFLSKKAASDQNISEADTEHACLQLQAHISLKHLLQIQCSLLKQWYLVDPTMLHYYLRQ